MRAIISIALAVVGVMGCRTTPTTPETYDAATARFSALCQHTGGRAPCDCCPHNFRLLWCHPWTTDGATCECMEDWAKTRPVDASVFSHHPPQRTVCTHWYP
ncbi:hypothetical protein HY480_02515 [Candidatus Uhrbacteria bacterium]|nr:hypothetical protein [Candidatus Uhrbacteria bacterium]